MLPSRDGDMFQKAIPTYDCKILAQIHTNTRHHLCIGPIYDDIIIYVCNLIVLFLLLLLWFLPH